MNCNDPENASRPPIEEGSDVLYKIDDVPPLHVSIALALQHYFAMFIGALSVIYLISPYLCIPQDDSSKGVIISTTFFVSGIATLIQTTFGSRLPIIQGPSNVFVLPTIAILSQPQWACPELEEIKNATQVDRDELWMSRMREIQGAMIIASIVEIILGATGAISFLMKWIRPLATTPIIALIGLSLFEVTADMCSENWGIAVLTMGLLIAFSQYLCDVNLPFPACFCSNGFRWEWIPIFKLFPVLLSILISWSLCFILTAADVLAPDSKIRTDYLFNHIDKAPWFLLLYPGQWGLPTVSIGSVLGIVVGIITSIIESLGDYHACARLAKASAPTKRVINRGILTEGIGCLLAGCFGTGSCLTSYSQNISAIAITKVASRHVIQISAIIMMIFGIIGKFGVVFMSIPSAIMGGVFCVMFGIIAGVGISNLQTINLNTSRNVFILGFSLFMGLSVPTWIGRNSDVIQTGSKIVDQIILIPLQTSMFVGGFFGCFLDNTIPDKKDDK